ncbi:MAG: winged helix-turn-helix domain-containing protein [Geminicoccaceae bacterium]
MDGEVGAFSRPALTNAWFAVGDWTVNPATRRLSSGHETYRLSPKATAVLVTMASAPGQVFSREQLLEKVWPHTIVVDEILTRAISELRRAFSDGRRTARVIETVHGAGYRLVAQVRTIEPSPSKSSTRSFSLEAYRLCMEAWLVNDGGGPGHAEKSLSLCLRALEVAPDFAMPHAAFAIAKVARRFHHSDDKVSLTRALEAAEQSVELAPDCPHSHSAKGFTLSALGEHSAAWRAFEQALAINPDSFEAHYLGARALFAAGDMAAAAALSERASTIHQNDFRALFIMASALAALGDQRRCRAAAHRGLGRIDECLAEDESHARARTTRACFLAWLGRNDEARDTVNTDLATGRNVQFCHVAALVNAGEIDLALDHLEQLVEGGWSHPGWLRFGPAQRALSREPRFQRIRSVLRS